MDFNHTANFHHVDSDDADSSLSEKLRGISSRNSFDSDYHRFKDPVPLGETLGSGTSSDFDELGRRSPYKLGRSMKDHPESSSTTPNFFPGAVLYSSKKMETNLLNDRNGRKSPPLSSPSTSPPLNPVIPIRQFTASSTTQQQSTVVKTTGLMTSGPPVLAGDVSRGQTRLIHEIKTTSQESATDSGHGSGHGSAQPHATPAEFQPFYKSELFETNPATESSKLLNTPSRRLEEVTGEERVPTPLMGMAANKMDLERSKTQAGNTTWRFLSLLYALVLIVLGTAFPLSEIIAVRVKPLFYQAFYVYLYGASILFLIFAYIFLLQTGRRNRKTLLSFQKRNKGGYNMEPVEANSLDDEARLGTMHHRPSLPTTGGSAKSGSFYLRMGALVFGLGSMIYSCLEFGQYFEIPVNSECNDVLVAVVPALRFFFLFILLYFVFLNSKIRVDRVTNFVRFGLMHMMATNICIWLSVLIGETKHELELSLSEPDRITPPGFEEHPYPLGLRWNAPNQSASTSPYKKPLQMYANYAAAALGGTLVDGYPKSCRAQTIIGNILQKASPFLYPCVVEYSLICAAMLYIMWSRMPTRGKSYAAEETSLSTMSLTTSGKRQRYTVDCHGATKGLFIGLLMIVMVVISMILFFVWIWRREYYALAVFQSYVVEIAIYTLTCAAVCMAFVQVRDLKFESSEGSHLNDLLLIISQFGVYIFCTFILISGHHTALVDPQRSDLFAMLSALLEAIQATVQTLFLLDATRRRPYKPEHLRDKPGRELVTFLLVCNFGLWAVDSMEAWKQQLYPAQTRFYGSWAWTMIMNVSMPLTIFYRFHSSVCLSEIWKKAWKLKSRPSTPVANS